MLDPKLSVNSLEFAHKRVLMAFDEFTRQCDYDWHGRLMFGTDLSVWQAHENCGLTARYRKYVRAFRATGLEAESDVAFRNFLLDEL